MVDQLGIIVADKHVVMEIFFPVAVSKSVLNSVIVITNKQQNLASLDAEQSLFRYKIFKVNLNACATQLVVKLDISIVHTTPRSSDRYSAPIRLTLAHNESRLISIFIRLLPEFA